MSKTVKKAVKKSTQRRGAPSKEPGTYVARLHLSVMQSTRAAVDARIPTTSRSDIIEAWLRQRLGLPFTSKDDLLKPIAHHAAMSEHELASRLRAGETMKLFGLSLHTDADGYLLTGTRDAEPVRFSTLGSALAALVSMLATLEPVVVSDVADVPAENVSHVSVEETT